MPLRLRTACLDDVTALEASIAASGLALSDGYYSAVAARAMAAQVFGVDTQVIRDETYFAIDDDDGIDACGGWSRRGTIFGSDTAKATYQTHATDGGRADPIDTLLDPARDPARIRASSSRPRMPDAASPRS